jgi:hypothetical protein
MSSNYTLGDTVKLAFQATENSIPITTLGIPKVSKIIGPDDNEIVGFPSDMVLTDSEFQVYTLKFKPSSVGDYIVIFTFVLEGVTYSSIERLTVSLGYSAVLPKAVAR